MSTSPQQPLEEALTRRQQDLEHVSTTRLSSSWGSRLLPVMFAAMETCWIDAILIFLASTNFLGLREPLVSLWSPFVLMAIAAWLVTYQERHGSSTAHGLEDEASINPTLLFICIGMVTLLVIWSSVYANVIAFYDPRWLFGTLNDLLLLDSTAYRIIGVVLLCAYFCWRGLRLARRTLEPGSVFGAMRLGMLVIITVLLLRAATGGGFYGELQLLILIPLFLVCGLIAHALAYTLFARLSHPIGLQGSIHAQERLLLLVVGSVGAFFVLIALLIGTFADPSFLAETQRALSPLGQVYDWLVYAFAYAVVFLLTPLFNLLALLHFHPQFLNISTRPPPKSVGRISQTPPQSIAVMAAIIKIVLPLVLIVLIVCLIWLALRRRRIVLVKRNEDADTYESLWSWQLFWTQFLAFIRAFWRRFFPSPAPALITQGGQEEIGGEPLARSVREIYRAFLRSTAERGYPRKRDETPYEFERRLVEHLPNAEPELGAVTQAYAAIRYGEIVPEVADVVRVQRDWVALQQKLQSQSQ